MAQKPGQIPQLISLDVTDMPITSVLRDINAFLGFGLIYSKSILRDKQGNELLVTAKFTNVSAITALGIVVEAIGFTLELFEEGHVIIKPPTFDTLRTSIEELTDDNDDPEDMPF